MSGSCHSVLSTGAYERSNESEWTANLTKTDSAESPQSTRIPNLSLCLSLTSLSSKCEKEMSGMNVFTHSIASIVRWDFYRCMSYYVVVGRWTSGKVWLFARHRLIIGNPWKSMVKALVLGKLDWAIYYHAAYIFSCKLFVHWKNSL